MKKALSAAVSLMAASCGEDFPERLRPVVIEFVHPERGAERLEVGTSGNQGTLTVLDVEYTLAPIQAEAVRFSEGCFALSASEGAPRIRPVVNVSSDSVAGRSFPSAGLTLRPLLGRSFQRPNGSTLVLASLEGGATEPPSGIAGLTPDEILLRCEIEALNEAVVSIDIRGRGEVDFQDGGPICSDEASAGCSRPAPGVVSFVARPATPGEDVTVQGCPIVSQSAAQTGTRFEVQAGVCVVRFGADRWFVDLQVDVDATIRPVDEGSFDASASRFEASLDVEAAVLELSFDESDPVPLMSAEGPCELANAASGLVRVFKAGAPRLCVVTSAQTFTLDLADSELPLTVRPGPSTDQLQCPVENGTTRCLDAQGDPISGPLVYGQATQVIIETPEVPRLEFGGDCERTGPGRAEALVDGRRSCTVRQRALQGFGSLELTFTENWGLVRVTAPGFQAECDARQGRVCLIDELPGPVTIELLSPNGATNPIGMAARPARPNERDDVPCGVQMTGPGVFELNPQARANDAGVVPRNALHRCGAEFRCNGSARFNSATFTFRNGIGDPVGEKTFLADDCDFSGRCSDMTEPVLLPADEDLTLELSLDSTGDGTVLDIGSGTDLLATPPSFVVVDRQTPLPFGAPFRPLDSMDPNAISAAAWVCRNGPGERLTMSFLVSEAP